MTATQDSSNTLLARRNFLKSSTGAALASVGALAFSGSVQAKSHKPHKPHKPSKPNEKYWKQIAKEFVLDKRTTYMNVGSTGSMPRDVLETFTDNNLIVAKHPYDMLDMFGPWPHMEAMVETVAGGFGAETHEIVLSRNTTDGMCSVIHGLQFEAGDVVLTTHHEHIAALSPLHVIAQRYDVEVVELDIPVYNGRNEITEDQFVQLFADAVAEYGDRVKLITFSHITYKTGTTLPAKRICNEVAVPNQIPTLVDGAHGIGMLDLDFHDMDCDFYVGAGHKWQCGPGATGILYVRDNCSRISEYWPERANPFSYINSSLAHYGMNAADTMQYVGNDHYPAKQALVDSCVMWDEIGRDVIEERVLHLSTLCKSELEQSFPDAYIYSPKQLELSSGLTTVNPFNDQADGDTLKLFRDRLREEYGYIVRTTDFYFAKADNVKTYALRISTHLFHSEDDVRGLVRAMRELFDEMS
ncbi:aminotransferase class V-fold PLP-dependent enzyme [Ferrimonas lipolytica]|uniref:Aminotransferase class V-fold PLP-dependent enzyme n=1 Tax=Ferrimonas lipolytica TaxID=2724191 RepID=A0A6H1UFP8_9GAMM|nr:aminotransferase class V-fold PLP-dependent enzyme [Ferrimonas lipolytica]QIZ77143.1 aminotransferase class V-fold PLP-dependent enzyme [Ferrimonas lipolytica]